MENTIYDLISAPWKVNVVFTAVRLKIFTILSNQILTVEEIASECGAISHLLKPLLDACVSIGLLVLQNEKYMNSHFSRVCLVEGASQYIGNLIELQYDESKHWNKLYDIILSSKSRMAKKGSGDDKHRTFITAMNNLGMLGEADALRNLVDLSEYKELVDAGGGSGLYSVYFCQKYPTLRITILDKSETLRITKELIADYKEKDRINLREANIVKDSFGENVDAVLLSDVIYDETIAKPVLKNAWNSLQKDGLLIIRGYYSDPERSKPLFGALFVLNQLVFDSSRNVMTISALQKNVTENGFKILKLSPLTELSFVLTAIK
jgi:predicted O-methyltransferase YrrM